MAEHMVTLAQAGLLSWACLGISLIRACVVRAEECRTPISRVTRRSRTRADEAKVGRGVRERADWQATCCACPQYDRLLWTAVQDNCQLVVSQQFGFTAEQQPMDVSEALTRIARQGHEWGQKVFIANFDVDKAFYQLKAFAVERAFLDHSVPTWAIAALLRKLVDQRARPT